MCTSEAKMWQEPVELFCPQLRNTIYTRKKSHPSVFSSEVQTIHLHFIKQKSCAMYMPFQWMKPFLLYFTDCHKKMKVFYISNSIMCVCISFTSCCWKCKNLDSKAQFWYYDGLSWWLDLFVFLPQSRPHQLIIYINKKAQYIRAVICKLWSPINPVNSRYFGLWSPVKWGLREPCQQMHGVAQHQAHGNHL